MFWVPSLVEHTPDRRVLHAGDQVVDGVVRAHRLGAVVAHIDSALDGRILAEKDGRRIEEDHLHARAHGIDVRQEILLRLDLLNRHLLEKFFLLERPLRDADAVQNVSSARGS